MLLSHEQVETAGFAAFNAFPHLCVEVPDGGFTISARTSEGKRVTISFVNYKDGGAAGCVDVQYHDAPVPKVPNGDLLLPSMHSVGFTVGRTTWDTREHDKPTTLLTVLLADSHYRETPEPMKPGPTRKELVKALGELLDAYGTVDELLDNWMSCGPEGATDKEEGRLLAANAIRDRVSKVWEAACRK